MGIINLPILYIVLGLLSIIFFCLMMMCPCCFRPCGINCGPRKNAATVTKSNGEVHYAKDMVVFGPFYVCLLATFITCFTVFKGAGSVGDGFKSLQESIEILETDIFGDMIDQAVIMREEAITGYNIARDDTNPNCDTMMDAFETAFDTLRTTAETLEEGIESIPPALKQGREGIASIAGLVGFAIFGLFAFFLAISVSYLLLEFFELRFLMKLLILATVLIETVATVILGIVLAVSMVLSDFCIDPVNTVLSLVMGGDDPHERYEALEDSDKSLGAMLTYYLYRSEDDIVCSGKDVIGEYLIEIDDALDEVSGVFDDFEDDDIVQDQCGTALDQLEVAFDATTDALTDTLAEASCTTINKAFTVLIEDGVCSGFATGLGEVWASQFFTTFFLFIVMCAAGASYHYFGVVEKVVPTDSAGLDSGSGDGVELDSFSQYSASAPPVVGQEVEPKDNGLKGEGEALF